jgi:transposase-like protein
MTDCPICRKKMDKPDNVKNYLCQNCRKEVMLRNNNLGFYRRILKNKWQIYSGAYGWQYIDELRKDQEKAMSKFNIFVFR